MSWGFRTCPSAFTCHGDLSPVAAKVGDVLAQPLEGDPLVTQLVVRLIPRGSQLRGRQEPRQAEPETIVRR